MKRYLLVAVLILPLGITSMAVAQTSAPIDSTWKSHNTWSIGAPMPQGIWYAGAVAVLDGEIYVAGGETGASEGTPLSQTQIYNPATNTWRAGVPLPTPLQGGSSAVVNGVWYVMGGSLHGVGSAPYTPVTWAYDRRARGWIAKAPMPIALHDTGVAVFNNSIYVIGGNADSMFRANTVLSYNPVTDAWKIEASLLAGKSEPSVGVFGTMIVAADGATSDGAESDNGDNEAYNIMTNTWTPLTFDRVPRNAACSGVIGSHLYVAGGNDNEGHALDLTESFDLSSDSWTNLAPMPQATQVPASAVYMNELYCFGGGELNPNGPTYNYVQIYHP